MSSHDKENEALKEEDLSNNCVINLFFFLDSKIGSPNTKLNELQRNYDKIRKKLNFILNLESNP